MRKYQGGGIVQLAKQALKELKMVQAAENAAGRNPSLRQLHNAGRTQLSKGLGLTFDDLLTTAGSQSGMNRALESFGKRIQDARTPAPKFTEEQEEIIQNFKTANKKANNPRKTATQEDTEFLQNMYGRSRPVDQPKEGFQGENIEGIDPETLRNFLDLKRGGQILKRGGQVNIKSSARTPMGGMTSAFRVDWNKH